MNASIRRRSLPGPCLPLLSFLLVTGCAVSDDADATRGTAGSETPPRDAETSAAGGVVAPRTTPDTPAGALLSRALEHHDPEGVWGRRPIRLEWVSSRPDGSDYTTEIRIDDAAARFDLEMDRDGYLMEYRVRDGELDVVVDGSAEIGSDARAALALDREGGLMWRNYYHFLAGLPMKLTDPGTLLADSVVATSFQGREVLAVRATYETDGGYPHWEFYFEPDSAALVGARFWREGRDVDGEYLVMEGVAGSAGLRIPATRMWYMNADDEYLGADEVRELTVGG